MFDTMTLTKTAGALCGALLIFLLGNWAAETIYSTGGGHGEDHAQGYVIDTGAGDTEEEVADEGPSLAELMAAADPANGESVFRNCAACHAVADGENKAGPHLYGVVGRAVGSVDGFGYSGALTEVAEVWTPVELNAFLENPRGYAPGTSMGYAGLRKAEDRADLIAYLDQTDGTTFEMPVDEAAAEEPAAEEGATEEGAAEEGATEEDAAEEGATEEGAAEEGATEEPTTEQAATEESGASDFAALVAAADLGEGERIFRRCAACHAVADGENKAGPHLFAVVGRDIASVEGFNYSDALKGLDGEWTPEKLSAWLEKPSEFAPGNRMGFPGLKDEQDRANLIGYLQSVGN
ncbi:Cytochrome c2 [Roseovarius azorensis]|uniref:Cytochrome c2 n=1 Tax=Roseovarius azorensis TaxID=1287727 RepID=A0A1H7RL55_9RHOB|nr:cytochrome c family protein [Roseovarius azorensis]SEL60738.1 Cytochrome c2 [Roseovarius azorensis]